MKGGPHGASLVTEHKHRRVLQREFVFWEREPFEGHLVQAGFRVIAFETSMRGTTGGQPTQWLRFTVQVAAEDFQAKEFQVRPLEGRFRRIFPDAARSEGSADEACRRFIRPIFARARVL